MGFFMRHCWLPRNQLHVRAMQNATWKVNLQGTITVHTTRKLSRYCEYHSPDHLDTTYSRSPLCFLQSNYLKAFDPFIILTALPWFPLDFHFCAQLLGIKQREAPSLMLSICWNLLQELGGHFSRSSGKYVMYMTKQTLPIQSLVVQRTVFQRQQLDWWRLEASEAGERKSYWEGAQMYHWRDGSCDPRLPALSGTLRNKSRTHHGFCSHESACPRHSIESALSHLILAPAGIAASCSVWVKTTSHRYNLAASHLTPMLVTSCSPFQDYFAQQLARVIWGVKFWLGKNRGNL